MNKSEPLGLPRGSVRALIVLLIDAAAGIHIAMVPVGDAAVLTLAAVVSTFYFVKRSGDPAVEELPSPIEDSEEWGD